MSAIPLRAQPVDATLGPRGKDSADIAERNCHVRYGPITAVSAAARPRNWTRLGARGATAAQQITSDVVSD